MVEVDKTSGKNRNQGKQHGKRGFKESLAAEGSDLAARDIMHLRGEVEHQFGHILSSDLKQELAASFFEQKWTDLTMGQMEEQLLVSFLEQGTLLSKMRARIANTFTRLVNVNKTVCVELHEAREAVNEAHNELEYLRKQQDNMEADFEAKLKLQLRDVEKQLLQEREDCERKMAESREQVDKMADTLKTLNSIFRTMRADTDTLRTADLRDAQVRLEKKVEEQEAELNQLRDVRTAFEKGKADLAKSTQVVEKLTEENASLQKELTVREAMFHDLMAKESERLTDEENAKTEDADGDQDGGETAEKGGEGAVDSENQKSNSGGGSEKPLNMALNAAIEKKDKQGLASGPRDSITLIHTQGGNDHRKSTIMVTIPPDIADHLVLRFSQLDDAVDVATDMAVMGMPGAGGGDGGSSGAGKKDKKRLACTGYRILLPNLMGYRPARTRSWVLGCIRAIWKCKQLSDSLALRAHSLRERFPEFVYCWFEPSADDVTNASPEQVDALRAEADENRWGLYYGVKAMVKASPEARLFYGFLDEKHGEDELFFFLHCMRVVDMYSQVNGGLPFGKTSAAQNFTQFAKQFKETAPEQQDVVWSEGGKKGVVQHPEGGEGPVAVDDGQIPDYVWVDVRHVGAATEYIMKKGSVEEKALIVRKALDQAVEARGRVMQKYLPRKPADSEANREASQVVDMGHWLKIMVAEYREEQSHRRAAIRLMFSTAGSGALVENGEGADKAAQETADGVTANMDKGQLSAVSMDIAQLCSMMVTLNSKVPTHEMVALYRDAFENGDGHVDIESFLKAAESRQFFSSCLRLPTFLGSEFQSDISLAQCADIGSVVNFHYTVFKHKIEEMLTTVPGVVQDRIIESQNELQVALSESANGMEIDGRRPLCAYRRVLDVLMHVRLMERERRGEYMTAQLDGVTRSDAMVRGIEAELTHIEDILGGGSGEKKLTIELLRKKLCTIRVQRRWRRRLLHSIMPSNIRSYMGRNYGSGKSGTKKRKELHSLEWTLSVVDVLFAERVQLLNCGDPDGRSSAQLSTCEFCYVSILQRIGNRALGELFVHDFFINLNHFVTQHPRIRLFALLCGIVVEPKKDGGNARVRSGDNDDEALFWDDIMERAHASPDYVSLFSASPSVEKFYLVALQVLRQNPAPAPVLTAEGTPFSDAEIQAAPKPKLPLQKTGLFPNTLVPSGQETKTLISWVEVGHAKLVLQYVLYHGGLHIQDVEKAVARVSLLVQKPGIYDSSMIGGSGLDEKDDIEVKIVKTDSILYIVVDEWRKETERRVASLRTMLKERVDPLSYDEFVVGVQNSLNAASGARDTDKKNSTTRKRSGGTFDFPLMFKALSLSPIMRGKSTTVIETPKTVDVEYFLGKIKDQLSVRLPVAKNVPLTNIDLSMDLLGMLQGTWETFQKPLQKAIMVCNSTCC
jgi:hypothetical protein